MEEAKDQERKNGEKEERERENGKRDKTFVPGKKFITLILEFRNDDIKKRWQKEMITISHVKRCQQEEES